MRLTNLLANTKPASWQGGDGEITGITVDSRHVQSGYLFIAVPGTQQDGRQFIADALAKGATAILAPVGTEFPTFPADRPLILVDDVRIALAAIAASFYPAQPETIVAVTGTSGKTSTAQFARELWQILGHASASIGTLGLITARENRYGSLTTPDAITLHQMLSEVANENITHLAMEASSHGLALHRLDGVRIKAAGFTNLSRDHLDFHGTMADYLAAKSRLFLNVLPASGSAILNADVLEYAELKATCSNRKQRILSYGKNGEDLQIKHIAPQQQGQLLQLNVLGKDYEILLPIIGAFQVWNSLCALGMVIASGDNPEQAVAALAKLSGVAGRLELVGRTSAGGTVFVDYAHKPDALENVLKALRPHVEAHQGAKLGVVFGCGGNRDAGKRPMMGAIAQRLADWVIVTDDNPRRENPAAIRREVLAGCVVGPNLSEIGDRAKAIAAAIDQLKTGDVLVIAGKGHEHGQIVGDQVLPFDDAAVARDIMGQSS